MSLSRQRQLANNLCTILQNGCKARLSKISVPNSKPHSQLLSILLAHGFISGYSGGTHAGPDPEAFSRCSISQRRLWVNLKYRDDQTVMRVARGVSKPSHRVVLNQQQLRELHAGKLSVNQRGLTLGEICIVRAGDGQYYEGRDALRAQVSEAEVLCRITT